MYIVSIKYFWHVSGENTTLETSLALNRLASSVMLYCVITTATSTQCTPSKGTVASCQPREPSAPQQHHLPIDVRPLRADSSWRPHKLM